MIDAYLICNGTSYLLKCNGKGWLMGKSCDTNLANPDEWWDLAKCPEQSEEIYACSSETLEELIVNLKMETLMND